MSARERGKREREIPLSEMLLQLRLCRHQDLAELYVCSCPTQHQPTQSQPRVCQAGSHGGNHKLQPSSYMSDSPAGCANRRVLLEDQFLLSKTAAKLCWQNTSSCKSSHLHERAPSTQLHQQSLCSALHKITTHPSPRGSLRALRIIDTKQKSKSD